MPQTYEPIATTTLSTATATITFTSIPASWTDLRLVFVAKPTSTSGGFNIIFNNDSSSNYSRTLMYGAGASAISVRSTDQTFFSPGNAYTDEWGLTTLDIFSYANSQFKTFLSNCNIDRNGSGLVYEMVGLWRSTDAITRIDITGPGGDTFVIGTTATLYGIKNA